jgi:prevent-host-death family protein
MDSSQGAFARSTVRLPCVDHPVWLPGVKADKASTAGDCCPYCAQCATITHMRSVASRELRNHTGSVLGQVAAGSPVAITVHGEVVAELHPPRKLKPATISRATLGRFLAGLGPDPDLRALLHEISGETTDELDREHAR